MKPLSWATTHARLRPSIVKSATLKVDSPRTSSCRQKCSSNCEASTTTWKICRWSAKRNRKSWVRTQKAAEDPTRKFLHLSHLRSPRYPRRGRPTAITSKGKIGTGWSKNNSTKISWRTASWKSKSFFILKWTTRGQSTNCETMPWWQDSRQTTKLNRLRSGNCRFPFASNEKRTDIWKPIWSEWKQTPNSKSKSSASLRSNFHPETGMTTNSIKRGGSWTTCSDWRRKSSWTAKSTRGSTRWNTKYHRKTKRWRSTGWTDNLTMRRPWRNSTSRTR